MRLVFAKKNAVMKKWMHLMSRILIVLVFLGILLKACSIRPLPDGEDGDVRFVMSGNLTNQGNFERKAGFEGQFLHTGFDQEENLAVYWGKFGQEGCINCADAIEIRFRDLDDDVLADAVHMDSLLGEGYREFFVKDGVAGRKKKTVSFTNESRSLGSPTYRWDFGDGTTSSQPNPIHIYDDPDLQEVRVCLETIDANGCIKEVCNDIQLGDSACTLNFTHTLDPNSTYVKFESEVTGAPPFDYEWSFGDGGRATLGNPGYFYPRVGQYEACLTATDALGCSITLCKKIEVDPALCEHNFSYRIGNVPSKDVKQFGRVEVIYTDPNGVRFTSAMEEQPETSYFEVLDRVPYERNASGQSTYAFNGRIACVLWNEDGNAIVLKEGKVDGAVAYP